jgi:hypothetical protein
MEYPTLDDHTRWLPNPHIARLRRQPGCLSHHTTWAPCLVVMSAALGCSLFPILLYPRLGLLVAVAFLLLLVPILFFVPMLLTTTATNLTAHDMHSSTFELLLLTHLTEWQLVWGYFYTVLWRMRTVLTVVFGFVFIVVMAVSIMATDMQGDDQIVMILWVWTAGVQVVGMLLMLIALTIAAVMVIRNIDVLRLLLAGMGLVLVMGGQVLTILAIEAATNNLAPGVPLWFYLVSLVLGGGPYILGMLALLLAVRRIREPLF